MSENKIKIIIFIILVMILTGSFALILLFRKDKDNFEDIHEAITNDYVIDEVYDFNEYQAIYKNLMKYYQCLNENENNIFDLLYTGYIATNQITYNNINNFIEKKFDNYGYQITEINKYYNPYYSIYYVTGTYFLEGLEEKLEEVPVKHLVIWDNVNNTYAVLPILNENADFNTIINRYDLLNFNEEINKNNNNEIIRETISQFNEASFYFNEFMNTIRNNCGEAYTRIGNTTKEKYETIEDFNSVCDSYRNIYAFPIIKSFTIENNKNEKRIIIKDTYDNSYVFLLENVRKYFVDINFS